MAAHRNARLTHLVTATVAGLCCSYGCGASEAPRATPPDVAPLRASLDADVYHELESATRGVESDGSNSARWSALGRVYERNNLDEQAEAVFETAASLAPLDPKPRYRAAIAAARSGDTERALAHLEDVLRNAPEYGPAWRRQGTWRLELGDAEGARDSFERAARLLPDSADAPLGLALAALQLDDAESALLHAGEALALAESDPYVRLIFGTALRRAGRADEAAAHLAAGQGAVPSYVDPWSFDLAQPRGGDEAIAERGALLEREKRFPEAVAVYRGLLESRRDDSKLLLALGRSLLGAGQVDEALAHYETACARFPGNYQLESARVSALRMTGRAGDALAAADALIARWPDRATAYTLRGDLLGRMNDIEGARAAFQRATELDPSDFRGSLFEGRLLLVAGRHGEAVQVLRTVLDIQGAQPPIEYFKLLLQAEARAGSSPDRLQAILDRARAHHGDAADVFVRKTPEGR